MKRKIIIFITFVISLSYSISGISENSNGINNREDALKYYKEKFKAVNQYSKRVKFDFSGSKTLKNEDLKYLSFFPDMTAILIGSKYINDEAFKYLQDKNELGMIYLVNTSVTGEGFKYLKNLKKIEIITINDSPLTDVGIKYLSEIESLSD